MKTLELNCEITRHIYPTGGVTSQGNSKASTEIYPINETTDQKMTGHLIHGGNTNLISMGGDTTTIYALGTGFVEQVGIKTRNVEVYHSRQ